MKTARQLFCRDILIWLRVKEEDCIKDMEKEGLDLEIQDGYLSAKQTSLGGDDGIAVAYSLALLASTDIPHPPLEAVLLLMKKSVCWVLRQLTFLI